MSELYREAPRRYMQPDENWEALLKRSRSKGKALGIRSEKDVERMSDEFRSERKGRRRNDPSGR